VRILFVSGTAGGGAALSTHELADRMAARGHEVGMVVRRRQVNTGLASPGGRWLARKGPSRVVRGMERALARRVPAPVETSHGPVWTVRHLERLTPALIEGFGPDVLVVNTVHARAWAALRGAADGVPTVLYVREHGAVRHAADGGADLVVANARSHADALARQGGEAVVVASVVDTATSAVESTRTTVLCINPIPTRGLDIALEVARRRPDLRFAFQESHRLSPRDHRILARRLRGATNVELRRYTDDRAAVYRDASVLLAPYLNDNRPRVVLEAQANGIPVVATDRPGLRESVGAGGVLVADDDWVGALASVLDDPERYEALSAAAREHAARPEVDPDHLAACFEAALDRVVTPASR
jgi:glycosyltransferase involved in cell wall biosynthesis